MSLKCFFSSKFITIFIPFLDRSQKISIGSREYKVNVGEFMNTESMSLTEVHLTASPNKSI